MTPVDAVRNSFTYLGVDAVFIDGEDTTTVRVMPVNGERLADYGTLEIMAPGTLYEIMEEDWQRVSQLSQFTVDGSARTIQGTPKYKDARRIVRVINSRPS